MRSVFAVVGVCGLLLTASFVLSERGTGRVVHGVRLAELDVSGLDRDQIQAQLQAWVEQRASRSIALTLAGSQLAFQPKTVGFSVNTAASAARALNVGRSGGIVSRFAAFVARRFRPDLLRLELRFEPSQLSSVLDSWQEGAIKDPPFAGGISVTGTTVTPLYPRSGTRLDRARVEAQLRAAIASGTQSEPLATRTETLAADRRSSGHGVEGASRRGTGQAHPRLRA